MTERPLHGIPILVKDNIATSDKMNNTGDTLIPRMTLWNADLW